jgi:hypothetical protein
MTDLNGLTVLRVFYVADRDQAGYLYLSRPSRELSKSTTVHARALSDIPQGSLGENSCFLGGTDETIFCAQLACCHHHAMCAHIFLL